MKVTAIQINDKNGAFRDIYIDGEFYASIPLEILVESSISVLSEISEKNIDELIFLAKMRFAKKKAYDYLSYSDLPARALLKKLTDKGIEEEIAKSAVLELIKIGLINDYRYGTDLAKRLAEFKFYGKKKISYELTRKGLSQNMTNRILDELELDTDEIIKTFVLTKYKNKDFTDKNVLYKIKTAAMRNGFSYDEVKNAFEKLFDEY